MKTTMMRWFMVMSLLTLGIPRLSSAEEEAEELPKAEPYRQTIRHSFNRMGGYGGGGGGGGGGNLAASYDLSKTYDSMIRKTSADKQDNADYDIYASESGHGGYGGYASESGYGLSCASGYVNASAVALLAFLFLLNIVQDIVEQIQTRKKRDVDNSDLFSFIHTGGLASLKAGLPEVVLPLMVDLMEATEAPHCLQRPLCEANSKLAEDYGIVGKVVASLLSNVVSKAFSGDDTQRFHLALQASSLGRSKGNCSSMFPSCGGLSYRKDVQKHNHDSTQPPELDDDLNHHIFYANQEPITDNHVG